MGGRGSAGNGAGVFGKARPLNVETVYVEGRAEDIKIQFWKL